MAAVTQPVAAETASKAVAARVTEPTTSWPFDHLISSMALSELVEAMDPPAPEEVRQAARALRYRTSSPLRS